MSGWKAVDARPDSAALAAFLRSRLLEEVDPLTIAALPPEQRRARLERRASDLLVLEGPVLPPSVRSDVVRSVVNEAIGLGALEPLLADESVTEVMVNGPHQVLVERDGRIERSAVTFSGTDQLMRTIERIVFSVNRRLDESSPMVDARLLTGERINVVIPPLALNGPVLTIRRFPRAFTLDDLARLGSMSPEVVEVLAACVRARLNILVCGGTGSGKTTLLNALSGFIRPGERVVTIEDVAELSLQGDHVVRLEARPANAEGRGEVSIRALVRNSLRMRPDRIIVGEVRGGEALDMLQAMSTGHEGSLTTVHANSTVDALVRLEALGTMSDVALPGDTLRTIVNSAVHLVVRVGRTTSGARRVLEVGRVASRRHEPFTVAPVVTLDRPDDPDATHAVLADPVLAQWIRQRGQSVPALLDGAA